MDAAAQDTLYADFVRRYLNSGWLVRGIVALHALASDMPRMFPPGVLFQLERRQYKLPLRNRQLQPEIDWLLAHMFGPERHFVLQQPYAAKTAEKAAGAIKL